MIVVQHRRLGGLEANIRFALRGGEAVADAFLGASMRSR